MGQTTGGRGVVAIPAGWPLNTNDGELLVGSTDLAELGRMFAAHRCAHRPHRDLGLNA